MTSPVRSETVQDVYAEARRALEEHGPLTTDNMAAMTILTEEVGEAAAELLALRRVETGRTQGNAREKRGRAIAELAQVAATACLLMDNLRAAQDAPAVI